MAGRAGVGRDTPIGRLHVIVDRLGLAEAALVGGAPTLQVRLKTGTDRERYELISAIVSRCAAAGALCVVDDRVDLALASGAGGVHVGEEDLPVAAARRLAGSQLVVGASVRNAETGQAAVADGADYLGVGPAYATESKPGLPRPLGPAGIAAVAAAVRVPVVAIGGIDVARLAELRAAGIHHAAVIGAVAEAYDPAAATGALLEALGSPTGDGGGTTAAPAAPPEGRP